MSNRSEAIGGSDNAGVWKGNLYREKSALPWDVRKVPQLVAEGMNPKTTLESVLRVAHTIRRCVETCHTEQMQYNEQHAAATSSPSARVKPNVAPTRLDRFTPDNCFKGGYNRELTKTTARHQKIASSSPSAAPPASRVDAQLAVGGVTAHMRYILLDTTLVPMLYYWLENRMERGMSGARLKVHVGHIFSMLLGHSDVTDDLVVLNPRFFHVVMLGLLYDVDPDVVAVGAALVQKVSELPMAGHILAAGAGMGSLQPEGDEAILPAMIGLLGKGHLLCHHLRDQEGLAARSHSSPRSVSSGSFLSGSKLLGRSGSVDISTALDSLLDQTDTRHPSSGSPILARENEKDTTTALLTALVNLSGNPRAQFSMSRCAPLIYVLVELLWRAGEGMEDQIETSDTAIHNFHTAVDSALELYHIKEARERHRQAVHSSKLYAPDSYSATYTTGSPLRGGGVSHAPFGSASKPHNNTSMDSSSLSTINGGGAFILIRGGSIPLRIDTEVLELDCDPVPLDTDKFIPPPERAALAAQVLANLLYYPDNISAMRAQCPTLITALSEGLQLSQQGLTVSMASTTTINTPNRRGGGATPRTPLQTARSQLSGLISVKTPPATSRTNTSSYMPSMTARGGLVSPSARDVAAHQQRTSLEQLGNACTVALEYIHNRDVRGLEIDMLTEMQRASPGSIRRATSVSIRTGSNSHLFA